ncbi:MAG: hypothetical protein WC718_00730 [Phycisphaerales bacterium]|jgi:hypothetical protein
MAEDPESSKQGTQGPGPGAAPPVDSRWTNRRVRATLAFSLVGLLVGFLSDVVILGALEMGQRMHSLLAIPAFAAAVLLVLLGVHHASYGTCVNRPVAPLGVAVGLTVGSLIPVLPAYQKLDVILVALPIFAALGICAFWGGRRGVRNSLGPPMLGVGSLCAHCGYDLRGTPEHTVCSECGGAYRYASMPPA